MSDLSAYLASNYMSGAKADAILSRAEGGRPKKKKRRVDKAVPVVVGEGTGLLIADEDSMGAAWGEVEEEEADTPVVTAAPKAFRMTKANWSTVGGSSLADTPVENAITDEPLADAESTPPPQPPVKKRKGGLLTAAQLKEEAEAQAIEEARKEAERQRERAEVRRMKIEAGEEVSADEGDDERPDHQQTIHRDRTGKIVDVNAERAEAQKREQEDRARQAAKKDWNKGLVQRNQRDEELRRERQAAGTSFARSAHDRNMNEEQRNEIRREDPAAAFLTKRKKKGPQRQKYAGPAPPPNRFGIPPGFRWDGVDRSTGYEAKLFQKLNDRKRKQVEAYAWGTEDM